MESIYYLSFGVEGIGPLDGTWPELAAILDRYPLEVCSEILLLEKMAGSRVYPELLRYVAMRMVERLDG